MIADDPDIDADWRGPFDFESDALFTDVAAGRITERDYWTQRSTELADTLGLVDGASAMRRVFAADEARVVRSELVELARDLRAAGFRTGILTNDLAKFHGGAWEDDLPSLTTFPVHVDLSHTATLKPHPEAYRLGVEAMGLPAEDVLFVDDQPVNVAGALAAGMQAIRFDVVRPSASLAAIRNICGIPNPLS